MSAQPLGSGRRMYVTVLREPVKRVTSEFFFACLTKKRTKRIDKFINTPEGPKALLDWSHDLWKGLNHKSCSEPSADEFSDWLRHKDNPAHARYGRFFIPRTLGDEMEDLKKSLAAALLFREHNCLAGDSVNTLKHWQAVLQKTISVNVESLSDVTTAMNTNPHLRESAMDVLLGRFWFVGILENIESSYTAFCELGHFAACGTRPPANEAIAHSSKKTKFVISPEMRLMIEERNSLDISLYNRAYSQLRKTPVSRKTRIV